jgi:hypothetical protein
MSSAGRYSRFVVAPLAAETRQRLRLNQKLRRHLREPTPADPDEVGLPSRLIRVLDGPANAEDRILWEWLYCYASSDVVRRLLRDGTRPLLPDLDLKLPDADALQHLLPQERFTPALQVYATSDGPRTLVCFTGNGQKLNVPVQLFHLLACRWFDRVIYLRDPQRQNLTQGIAGLAADFDALVDVLSRHIQPDAQVSVLSVSSGGFAAMRYAQRVPVHRVALFSSPLIVRECSSIDERVQLELSRLRLYFSDSSHFDKKLRAPWNKTVYRHCFHLIETDSHATLTNLLASGAYQELFAWLSLPGRQALASHAA